MQDVQHAIREPCLFRPSAEQVRRHGSHLARFGHHTIAAGQGRCDLPREEVQRKVPGADASDHPKRLAQRVVDRPVAHGVAFAGELFGCGGVEAKVVLGAGNVDNRRYGNGLSVVAGFRCGEHIGMFGHLVGQPHQDGTAVSWAPGPPGGKCRTCRGNGRFDVLGTGPWHAAVHLPRGRFDIVQPITAQCGLQLTVDEIEDVLFHGPGLGPQGGDENEKDRSPRVPVFVRLH